MTEHNPFRVDPDRLDAALLEQPHLSREAGVREAEARQAHAAQKARLEVVRARLYLSVRANPVQHRLREKPTEAEVDAAVTVSPEYQAEVALLNEAKFALDVATADTTAYLDRRKAVEGLIELMALNYYAEREVSPRTPAGQERVADARRRASRASD